MLTLSFPPNLYLDRRLATWEPYERGGLVRYDLMTQMVKVDAACGEIVANLHESTLPNVTTLTQTD